ncbi:Deleted in malignant brain tumors 1 protein [Holothuria leucospilota]|uniref:Deleted in malignant brain tumors 1 protein n=1 Tax=Holothuria leucospilota TaxID=206669 RepID=A0A9Q0YR26_HOLLE|nr:Deleted in malignant brain tumors 1 protein [Holothuria leucospilota]
MSSILVQVLLLVMLKNEVNCSSLESQEPEIRLADGNERQGRVEVNFDGEWGTICGNGWDILDAQIVCRQLGFLFAEKAKIGAFFGEGNGRVFMDEVTCTGTEGTLFDCQYSKHHNCLHSEDAGVVCSSALDIRLVGDDETRGLIEVYFERRWGPVCADTWDNIAAEIACRQLGYLHAREATKGSIPAWTESSNDTLLSSIKCKGDEITLSECAYVILPNCPGQEFAGVICSEWLEIISCPSDIHLSVPPNVVKAPVVWSKPIVIGGMVSTTCSHELGSLFDIGLTEVTYNFKSKTGDEDSCSFYVAVCPADCYNARQYCPSSVTQEVEANTTTIRVYWSDLMYSKCNYSVWKSHSSGDEFSIGITEVTYKCTDSKFVYSLCKFTVNVFKAEGMYGRSDDTFAGQ